MILKISFRAKAGVPKTLVKQKPRLNSLYFPQNTLMFTESCGEFRDLHSIFKASCASLLMKKKGVYPYDYMDSFCKFNDAQLPGREDFIAY